MTRGRRRQPRVKGVWIRGGVVVVLNRRRYRRPVDAHGDLDYHAEGATETETRPLGFLWTHSVALGRVSVKNESIRQE